MQRQTNRKTGKIMAATIKKSPAKAPVKGRNAVRKAPLKVRKLRGFKELVPDPFNLGI